LVSARISYRFKDIPMFGRPWADRRSLRENGRMRPGNQSNKRMRGRGRKGPNPLTRTYESNGPDVKIRGTAMHIAEKYQQLARDAQASGDRVMSENYNQHAEHYLRIVAAAQPPQQNTQHTARHEADDNQDQAAVNGSGGSQGSDQPSKPTADNTVVDGDAPQPFIDNMPVIDQEGQVNGAAQSSDEAGEAEEKPRRRTRTPRARSPRKAASEAGSESEAQAGAGGPEAADEGEEQPKPRRRTTRTRRTKATEDTPSETAAAGE
jgi:hypothetical protein